MNLNDIQPDRERFPTFSEELRDDMLGETDRFFTELIREDRSLKYDYHWITPGPKCMHQKDLQRCIQKILFKKEDEYRHKRRTIFDMSFSHKNGSAAKHILKTIHDEIANSKDDKLLSLNLR